MFPVPEENIDHYVLNNTFMQQVDWVFEQYSTNIAFYYQNETGQIQTYTYKQFEDLIESYIVLFIHHRIIKGSLVILHLPASPQLYAMIMALWKIGAIYIPLSVELDTDNLKYRLLDSGARYLISATVYLEKLQGLGSIMPAKFEHIINLEDDTVVIPEKSHEKYMSNTEPSDYAYLVYTSGTTSISKGILIKHEALLSRFYSHHRVTPIKQEDRVAQFFGIHTDPSIMEMLLAFSSGASLCIWNLTRADLVANLSDHYDSMGVSVSIIPPSVLENTILDERPKEFFNSHFIGLRLIISATEAVSTEVLEAWRYRGEESIARNIGNGYGSTETTVGGMYCLTQPGENVALGGVDSVFLGNEIYLLSNTGVLRKVKNLFEIDVRQKGELCIAGIGLGEYWLNGSVNSERTNEYFCRMSNEYGEDIFVYKSGDLIEYNQGQLYFCRRLDNQVKVSGNRIETEYIEHRLVEHPDIRDAIVCLHQKRLVAYIFLSTDLETRPTAEDISLYLNAGKKVSATTPSRYFILGEYSDLRYWSM